MKFFDRVKADRNLKKFQAQLKKAVMDGEEDIVAVSARSVPFINMIQSRAKAAFPHHQPKLLQRIRVREPLMSMSRGIRRWHRSVVYLKVLSSVLFTPSSCRK